MPLSNTTTHFGSVTKTFHWLTALLILTAIALGLIADDASHAARAAGADQSTISRAALLFSLHKTVGVATFFTALARILWALSQPRPRLLNGDHKAEALLAETIHWLLYTAMLLTPLTGWIHHAASAGFAPILWPFGQTLPMVAQSETLADLTGGLHYLFQWLLIGSIALHVAGALKHHVIDRDDTLRRMLPGAVTLQRPPLKQPGHATPIIAALAIWALTVGAGFATGILGKSHTEQASAPTGQLQQVASDWQVQTGTLEIAVQQFGSGVTGAFNDWTAAITFADNPAQQQNGNVTVTVSIPSLTLGSVTDQALGADFLNAPANPTATFTADILRDGENYTANGTLTLNGQTKPLSLPFTLQTDGNTATMQGSTEIARLDYNIGQTMPKGDTLGLTVAITVNLTATKN